jgi:hypothetical protein
LPDPTIAAYLKKSDRPEKGVTNGSAAKDSVPTVAKNNPKEFDLRATIMTLGGDTLRHLSMKPDTGFQVLRWYYERDGIFPPQYAKAQREYPGGAGVPPGEYKAVFQYSKFKDSLVFKLLPDPRFPVSEADFLAREAKIAHYTQIAKRGNQAFDQIREARTMIDRYEKILDNVGDTQRDSLKKLAKPVRDTIKTLMELYLDPEELKGLDHVTLQLGDLYFVTASYLEPISQSPGNNAEFALQRFERAVQGAVLRINRFLENDWLRYRKAMEGAAVPLFKDLPPVKTE